MNVIDWAGYLLGFYNELLLHWSSVITSGRLPATTFAIIWSQIGQLFFCGMLGILFAYIMLKLTGGNYLLKGLLYGVITWFTIYAISISIRLPYMNQHDLPVIVSHFIAASVYGMVTA